MKWVFLALLLANIWYFWTHSDSLESEPQAPVVQGAPGNSVNQLLILSELQAGELSERGGSDDASSGNDAVQAAASPRPSSSVEPEPAKALVASGLRSTRDEAQGPSDGVCLSFGPLAADAPVPALRQWLGERGGRVKLHEAERRELSLYWVFFPPFPSRAAAVARVEDMRTRNLSDIYIISRGDMTNAISLGVYSRKESLDRRLRAMRSNGYEPSVAPRYKTERATWLDAVFAGGFSLDTRSFAKAFAKIDVRDIACSAEVRLADDEASQVPAEPEGSRTAPGDDAPSKPDREADVNAAEQPAPSS